MEDFTDEKIKKLLKAYKRKREKEKERYERLKDTEEFKEKNRKNALNHYYKNKDKKKEYYQKNKEYMNAITTYQYWLKKGNVDRFIEKCPEKYELLKSRNYFKDQNPS